MTYLKSLLKNPAYILATTLAAVFLIGNWLLVKSQNPTTPATLQGQTQAVTLRPWGTVHAGRINYSLDTDHDGMPDEVELANGLDPNNPADADGDLDGDGLTNGDEVTLGTGLQTLDSDGDGVSDAEEVRQGYNPLDATSTPPAGTQVVSLQVSPTRLGLSLNTLLGNIPAQLTVTGTLSDGSTVDLTRSPGTSYQSLDSAIATIDSQGSAVGIAPGTTTIQVRNGLLTAQTNVVVSAFTPRGEGRVEIPGFANNVDVSGNFAFVASGAAGLQVVDATNPTEAYIAASVQLPGPAVDVRVVGTLAYIAAGDGGLQIVDISDPYNPQRIGGVEFSRAIDVVIKNNRAYVAAGIQGFQIVDITTPTNPTLLGSLSIPEGSKANGVDVDPARNVAVIVVANLTTPASSRLLVVDVADPLAPTPVGSLSAPQVLTRPQDVVINGTAAYVVDARSVNQPGLIAVDISNPAQPTIAGLGNLNFDAFDIEVHNNLAFTATQAFSFAYIPMFSVTNPLAPSYVGAISPSQYEDYGSGVAVNDTLVFLTSSDFTFEKGEGETAPRSFLLIGRYLQPPDTAGMAPTVDLVRPFPGEILVSGDEIEVVASAFDDTGIAVIEYRANGQVIGVRSSPPSGVSYTVPAGLNEIAFDATAADYAANTTTSAPVTFQVIPDPLTTVMGYVVNESLAPVEGVTVVIRNQESLSTVTDSFGGFSISGVGTIPMTTPIDVIIRNAQGERLGTAFPRPAVRGGVTDLGTIGERFKPGANPTNQALNPAMGSFLDTIDKMFPAGRY